MAIKAAPLNSTFLVTSMLGFLISMLWVYPKSKSWGVAFALVFLLMFVSSIISMTYGNVEAEIKMDAPKPKKVIKN
jgi:hypothetical protein